MKMKKSKEEIRKRSRRLAGVSILAAALAYWCYERDQKYPVAKGYRIFNKFYMPAWMMPVSTASFANRILKDPEPNLLPGISRSSISVPVSGRKPVWSVIYRNEKGQDPAPCLVYIHGGGFFLRDAPYIHERVMEYALKADCTVVFVEYQTADQAAFPVPFEDCVDTIQYVYDHAESLGIDPKKIAVGGDSAGGCLAAASALWCRDHQIPLCFQMLIYPVTDCRMNTRSDRNMPDSPLWNSSLSKKMWEIYLHDGLGPFEGRPEYASPVLASDFSGLPPAYIEVEQFDSLRDDGLEYAHLLEKAKVPVQLEDLHGSIHGFDVKADTALTRTAMRLRILALKKAFGS